MKHKAKTEVSSKEIVAISTGGKLGIVERRAGTDILVRIKEYTLFLSGPSEEYHVWHTRI